jgi:hypothetical protein
MSSSEFNQKFNEFFKEITVEKNNLTDLVNITDRYANGTYGVKNIENKPLLLLPNNNDLQTLRTLKTIEDAKILIKEYLEKIQENYYAIIRIMAEKDGFDVYESKKDLKYIGFSKKKIDEIMKQKREGQVKVNIENLNTLFNKTKKDFENNSEIIGELYNNISKSYRYNLSKFFEDNRKKKEEKKTERSGKDEKVYEEEVLDEGNIIEIDDISEDEIKYGFQINPYDIKTCEVRSVKELLKYAKDKSIDLGTLNKLGHKPQICKIIIDHLNKNRIYNDTDKFGVRQETDKLPYKYVSGLLTLEVYENSEWNKIIYLLGEQHSLNDICDPNKVPEDSYTNAVRFFFSLLDSTTKNLDVFLEFDYKPTKEKPQSRFSETRFSQYYNIYIPISKGYMNKVNNILALEGCFKGYEKSGCDYYKDHIRFHLSDVRDIDTDVNQYIHKVFHFMEYEFLNLYDVSNYEENINKVKEFIEKVVKPNEKYNDLNIFQNEVRKSLYSAKVIKQLLAIDPKYKQLETMLNERLEYSIEHDLSVYQPRNLLINEKLIKFLEDLRSGKLDEDDKNRILSRLQSDHTFFKNNRGNIYNIYMDMYLLFRLFKTFKTTDESHKEAKNIIIYSGNTHTNFYRSILSSLKFNKIFSAGRFSEENQACLDISDFKIKWL